MRFKIKDIVRIQELNRDGIVIAIYISVVGTQYNVRCFDNADVKEVYFYEEELNGIPR